MVSRGWFNNTYGLLKLIAFRISTLYRNRIFQCIDKTYCVVFQWEPLKFHKISYPYIERCASYLEVICQISRSHGTKTSPILTRIEHLRTVTPVWIHPWLWNDAQSLIQYRTGSLLLFKVIHQIARSHGTKNLRFWPELSVTGLLLVWIHRGL